MTTTGLALQLFDRELVQETVVNNMITYSYSPKWPAVKAELEASLPEREHDIELLRKQRRRRVGKSTRAVAAVLAIR
jgi:hypothetical protein